MKLPTTPADSPEAVLRVGRLLVNIGRRPLGFELVHGPPEVDEEVGDFASGRQDALQVGCVVTGEAEAAR